MTFEEFFAKKKIDLSQLQGGNPLLYDEFKQHFVQMGEKSFDHTKKFWFNKLRKEYGLLEEEETATKDQAVSAEIISEAVSQPAPATATAAASSKPAGFKPRFKAGVTKATEAPTSDAETPNPEANTTKTPTTESAKAADTPQAEGPTQPSSDAVASPAPAASSKPVGFKPRFKAGATKKPPKADE